MGKFVEVTGRSLFEGDYALVNFVYKNYYGSNFGIRDIICKIGEYGLPVLNEKNKEVDESILCKLLRTKELNKHFYAYKLESPTDEEKKFLSFNTFENMDNLYQLRHNNLDIFGRPLYIGDFVIYDITSKGVKYGILVENKKVYCAEKGLVSPYHVYKVSNLSKEETDIYNDLKSLYSTRMMSILGYNKNHKPGELYIHSGGKQFYLYLGKYKCILCQKPCNTDYVIFNGMLSYYKEYEETLRTDYEGINDLYFHFSLSDGYGRRVFSSLQNMTSISLECFMDYIHYLKNNSCKYDEKKGLRVLSTKIPKGKYGLNGFYDVSSLNQGFVIYINNNEQLIFTPID